MNKVALITGGSRGIGFGIATHLAQAGFDLAINGIRDESQVVDVLKDLRSKGSDVIYAQGNLASSSERKEIISKTKKYFGRLNLLVNNAVWHHVSVAIYWRLPKKVSTKLFSTNLKALTSSHSWRPTG